MHTDFIFFDCRCLIWSFIKEIKEGTEFRSKLREDVNALQGEYDTGRKQMKEGSEFSGKLRQDIKSANSVQNRKVKLIPIKKPKYTILLATIFP